MRILGILATVPAASIRVGCGNPVPAEKGAYIGEREAPDMTLVITQEGRVAYGRSLGAGRVRRRAGGRRL